MTMSRVGWVMTALFALFMLGASVAPKLLGAQVALDSLTNLGWPADYLLLIGIMELACTILFVLPRTGLLGALLMMGILGGAMASHMRVGSPLVSHTLFSVWLGAFMWLALWLRDERTRKVLPLLIRRDAP